MSLSRHDRPRVLQHVVRLLSLRTDARGEATVLSLSLYLPARRDAIWPPVEDEATGSCSPSTYADATGEAARPPLRENPDGKWDDASERQHNARSGV